MSTASLPSDPFGALCRENHASVQGATTGSLAGLTFAAKDVFDIRGARTGFGHPDWLASHSPAEQTAAAVTQLLDAGATLIGRTVCDELCYSLAGDNVHYGAPQNPRAPDRLAGGSSSGSAAAVAGGLVDFSLGTDCGGSVRVPAAFCGIFGIRPSYGRASLAGVHPFAESFDCAGWMARDPDVMMRVARVLLSDDSPARPIRRLLIARDAFSRADADVCAALAEAVEELSRWVGRAEEITLSPRGLEVWFEAFRVLQAAEIWGSFGDWIAQTHPRFGPGASYRFSAAAGISPEQKRQAEAQRISIAAHLHETIRPGDVVCLPTTPRPAPLRDSSTDDIEISYRHRAMSLLCSAGIGGLPQVTLPVAAVGGAPVGLSLLGSQGSDIDLLALAAAICAPVQVAATGR